MTDAELQTFRQDMKIEVIRVLLRGLYTGLANSSPTGGTMVRNRFEELRKEHAKIALPGLPEGYSDMLAGEYQVALDETIAFIEAGIRA